MGKLKKAGVNEKAVDARVAKETAKASKKEKELKQKEDADWVTAGEGAFFSKWLCYARHPAIGHHGTQSHPDSAPFRTIPQHLACASCNRGKPQVS
jgi:hypothetical protein